MGREAALEKMGEKNIFFLPPDLYEEKFFHFPQLESRFGRGKELEIPPKAEQAEKKSRF